MEIVVLSKSKRLVVSEKVLCLVIESNNVRDCEAGGSIFSLTRAFLGSHPSFTRAVVVVLSTPQAGRGRWPPREFLLPTVTMIFFFLFRL